MGIIGVATNQCATANATIRKVKPMPKQGYSDREWICSWDCGYTSPNIQTVIDHENTKHSACARVVFTQRGAAETIRKASLDSD